MLTTLAWLAQQAPPAPTPTDLRPALYGVGGTLLGVAASTVVQLVNAYVQRRHENRGRAFDARYEFYLSFLVMIEEYAEMRTRMQTLRESEPTKQDLDEVDQALIKLSNDLVRTGAAGLILSNAETSSATKKVLAAVDDHRAPSAGERYALRTAIRKELGLEPA